MHYLFLFQMAVVHFFTQQMQVHHPQGAKTTQDGAIAADFLKWKVGHLLFYWQNDCSL